MVRTAAVVGTLIFALVVTACGSASGSSASNPTPKPKPAAGPVKFKDATLRISAIPDQDPAKLTRLYGEVATFLVAKLGVKVEYVPVTDYAASVSAFQLGDLDLVWFGGLTGVQARLQTKGAQLIGQRDIDAKFRTVFIANAAATIAPFTTVDGLKAVKGHSITFGSESSTSGRLMPQYFLDQAGVATTDLSGRPGFSGGHDATIKAVEAGTFEVGALNSSVWDGALAAKTVDPTKVIELFRTPPYFDYHWLARPDLDAKFGKGFSAALSKAILGLDPAKPAEASILTLFGAKGFVPTTASNYVQIEKIARKLGLITG